MTPRKPGSQRALRQRGQALLLALLVLGVAGGAVLFSYYRPATLTLESDQKTTDAMAFVKTALIGYALSRGDIAGSARPGDFPCPDTDNDGNAQSSCAAGRLGRIPWKTLGIPEPKDASGETLWYASGAFRPDSSQPSTRPINSDTKGDIIVYAADGTTQLTSQAVAVIFAPGPALGTQNRDPSTTAFCTTTSTTIARNLCAANYLDAVPVPPATIARNNATTNGPFIVGRLRDPANPNYNDRVIYITTADFMPALEIRVAKELKTWLDGYRTNSACQCYPWADTFTSTNSTSNDGVNRGRLPLTARPEDWGDGTIPALSSWFGNNKWHTVIYYALAKQNARNRGDPPYACTTCSGLKLSVDGKDVISAIFFMPGTPLGTQNRDPSTTAFCPTTSTTIARNLCVANYLDDPANNDDANDTYITPTATTPDRDRIYTSVSAPAAVDAGQQCRDMGRALRKLTPCGQPPKLNPQCANLAGTDVNGNVLTPAQGLQVCSSACATAAWRLVNPPCQNTTKPSVCRNARETLEEC